jgi:hypothetical protein
MNGMRIEGNFFVVRIANAHILTAKKSERGSLRRD